MRVERRHSILHGFDFRVLDDPDFQEDSVREEIIVPILKGLGYGSAEPYKIIRSKKLLHPFVTIGSATKKIYLIPDYLLEVDGRFAWTLEAKAPNEKILNSKHVEQAYSYAIHKEIRVPYFALCNGKEFVLFHISKPQPVVHFRMEELPHCWDELVRLLGPKSVLDYDFNLKKDFGLHLKRLGFDKVASLIFMDVPISFIGKIGADLFSFGSGLKLDEGDSYVATFDFNSNVLEQLRGKVPNEGLQILRESPADAPTQVTFVDSIYRVTVDCRVGANLTENENEIFLPLWINRIVS